MRTIDGIAKNELVPAAGQRRRQLRPQTHPDDARVDFTAPALRVDRLIRACTPAPGAWTRFRGTRIKLGPVEPLPDAAPLPPGQLVATSRDVLVGTATHPVRLGEVQPQGKKAMPAADWARGARIGDGERFGDD